MPHELVISPNSTPVFALRSLRPSVQFLCILLAASLLTGCGGERPDLLPVSGGVIYDNKPLTTGTVSLHPIGATGHIPTGVIDKDGRYSLSTNYQPGAPPGRYKAVVHATEPIEAAPGKASPGLPKSLIPSRYNQGETSPLEIEVKAGAAPGAYDLKLDN
jgi:hypothetical protein